MESLEHNCGNNSPAICTNMLILGKDTFLVLIAQMISINPISSQIIIFVTSHFVTLLRYNRREQENTHMQSGSLTSRELSLYIKKVFCFYAPLCKESTNKRNGDSS